jgi:hypothetical protein
MHLPGLIYFLAVLVTFIVHFRYNLPLWGTVKKLESCGNRPSTLQMLRNPESIHKDSDSPDVKALKRTLLIQWAVSRRMLWVEILIMLAGMALSFISGFLLDLAAGKP